MKCENCGNQLIGAAIICRVCNHNNAMQRLSDWRSKRVPNTQDSTTRRTITVSPSQRFDKSSEDEVNLLRFPAAGESTKKHYQPAPTPIKAEPEVPGYPPWRAQVKERVKQARERRLGQPSLPQDEADEKGVDPNPVVAAALKRIRRSSPTTPLAPSTRSARQGSRATALAEDLELDPEPRLEQPQSERRPPIRQVEQSSVQPFRHSVGHSTIAKPATSRIETKPPVKPEAEIKPRPEIKTQGTQGTSIPKAVTPLPKVKPKELPKFDRERIKDGLGPAVRPAVKPAAKPEQPELSELSELEVEGNQKFSETQIIEIPYIVVSEMTDLFVNPATLWVRTLAGACDFEVIAMAYLPIFAAYATLNTSFGKGAIFILTILLAATTFAYQAVTLSISGRTFGMALLNMHLINTEDESLPVTRRQRLLRAWAATVAFLCPPLNLIVMRLNKHRLSLPDLISGTTPIEE